MEKKGKITMEIKGQTVKEMIKTLKKIDGLGIVVTDYKINAITPDGDNLQIVYDHRDV